MTYNGAALFDLLPALYRLRDAQLAQSRNLLTTQEQSTLAMLQSAASPLTVAQQAQLDQLLAKAARGPLASLLMLIAEQLGTLEADLDQLYDDQFIETCAKWVIPYIGDLIGYRAVNGVAPAVASPRAEVAHTISFRRRKGTILVLEQLARDVTGWGAHAVEFFQFLGDTQYLNHPRPRNHYAPDLRRWQPREFMNSGFDQTAHTVDVRRIASERGRYNIQNIGVFLWSLNAYSLTMATASAVASAANCFRFNPLGRDLSLFNHPVSQGADIGMPAEPLNVPNYLRRRELCRDIELLAKSGAAHYYGIGKSLALYVDGVFQNKIRVCNLSGADGSWANPPATGDPPAVDPELGRIALPPLAAGAAPPLVQASFYYGFNADLGGGEYPRADSFDPSSPSGVVRVPGDYPTIDAACAALAGDGVVEITDSRTYRQSGFPVSIRPNGRIELRAHDGFRPVVILDGELVVTGGPESVFNINGVVLASTSTPASSAATLVRIPAKLASGDPNNLSQLNLSHCTLVPGWIPSPQGNPSSQFGAQPVLAAELPAVRVTIAKSIIGAIRAHQLATVSIADSIVDAGDPSEAVYAALDGAAGGGALTLQGVTAIGKVHAALLTLVSDSIVWGSTTLGDSWRAALWADRKQQGCVRFSYIPAGAIVPRQFKCVTAGYGVNFPAWTALQKFASGQVIAATAAGAVYLYRVVTGGTTGAVTPAFSAPPGSLVADGGVLWQNAGAPGITPGPLFESLRFGDPGYAKLLAQTDDSVRRGADDGGEMGAFHFVLAPLRETDLRVRMQEYTPVGLEFGVFYAT